MGEDSISRCELFNRLATIPAPPEANEFKAKIYAVIQEMETADRPQEWIPCSDGMPEYRKTVLISTFWGVKTGFLDSTEAYGDFWEIIEDDATVSLYSVYAWMPLPKPWKGADDE